MLEWAFLTPSSNKRPSWKIKWAPQGRANSSINDVYPAGPKPRWKEEGIIVIIIWYWNLISAKKKYVTESENRRKGKNQVEPLIKRRLLR